MTLHVNGLITVVIASILLAPAKMFGDGRNIKLSTGPTAENALAADQELAKALQNNDTVGIYRMLDKDWAVIPSNGGVYEGTRTLSLRNKDQIPDADENGAFRTQGSPVRRYRAGDIKGQAGRSARRQNL
jgi:hypothetical protein